MINAGRPLKILHVTAPAPVGGLEQVVYALAVGHLAFGFDVRVAAILDEQAAENHDVVNRLRAAEVPIHPLVLPSRSYRRERAMLTELCSALRPDVVHTHGYRADIVDAPAARRLAIPTVTTVHGFTGGGWKNRAYEFLQRRAFARFDSVVAVSRPLAASLAASGLNSDRLYCLPNAWFGKSPTMDRRTARRRLLLADDRFQVGFVGRLSPEKGADLFLRALSRLRDLPLGVSVIGSGRMQTELQAQATELGIAERITWHGLVPNMGELMTALDVFVLSSRTEGTPIVLFEAMAAEVPVVATGVGGVPDVVTAGEAVVVDVDENALADGIRSVYTDRNAARVRAARALSRLEREFSREPWLRRYEGIYRQTLARRLDAAPHGFASPARLT